MQASIRSFALLGLVFSVACSSDGFVADGAPESSPTQSADPDRPVPNISGSQIRLVEQHPALVDALPEVLPREPADLVVEDCEGLRLFDVPETSWDSESKILTLHWWDPGAEASRSLTILADTPSCAAHIDDQSSYGIEK